MAIRRRRGGFNPRKNFQDLEDLTADVKKREAAKKGARKK